MAEPVDLSNLKEMTDGNIELEKELFAEFISASDDFIKKLEGLSDSGDNEAWRSTAHAFKGTSYNLGAKQLGDFCKKAQENPTSSANEKKQMLSEMKQEYQVVKSFLLNIK